MPSGCGDESSESEDREHVTAPRASAELRLMTELSCSSTDQDDGRECECCEHEKHVKATRASRLGVFEPPTESRVLRVAERLFDLHARRVDAHEVLGAVVL